MKTKNSKIMHCFAVLLIVVLLMTSFMAVGFSAISQKSEANATSPHLYYFSDCGESSACINEANFLLSYSTAYIQFEDEDEFFQQSYSNQVEYYDYIIFESRYHSFENKIIELEILFNYWNSMGAKIMFIYGFAPGMILSDTFLDYVDIFITTDVFTHRFLSLMTKIEEDYSAISGCVLSGSTWIINEGVELMPYYRYDRELRYSHWYNFSQDFFRKYLLETYGQSITGGYNASLYSILTQLDIELYIYNEENDSFYDTKMNNYISNICFIELTNRNLFTFWSTYDRAYGAKYPILDINYMNADYFGAAIPANSVLNFCSYMYNSFNCASYVPIYRNGITLYEFDEDLTEMIYSFLNDEPLEQYDNIDSRCDVTHLMTRFGDSGNGLPLYLYNGQWNFWNLDN